MSRFASAAGVAIALLGFAAPVQAQAELIQPTLELGDAYLVGEASDGIAYFAHSGPIEAPWSLTFQDAASAAAELQGEGGFITWTLACTQPLTMPVTTIPVEFIAGQTTYSGKQGFTVQADPATPAIEVIHCPLTAVFTGTSMQAQDIADAALVVAYHASLNVSVPSPSRSAGPQKEIVYSIRVENQGNARTTVQFELVEHPKDWIALAPEQVQLDAGQELIIPFIVATPNENGYNKDDTDIRLRATPSAWADPEQTGEPVEFSVHAKVDGFYVPGPSLPLLVLVIGLVSALAGRRS